MATQLIGAIAVPALIGSVAILAGWLFERAAPAKNHPSSSLIFNLWHMIPFYGLHAVFKPLVSAGVVLTINRIGAGFIILPTTLPGLIWGVALYTISADLAESAFHLAQHKFRWLWKMHSLHHTDGTLNASTALRHFWAEELIKTATIYAAIALLFRANPPILASYAVIGFYNFYLHMNVKGGLGRFSWLINTPQYHRLHHSRRPEDYNLRYAAIFPIFDLLCGTYRRASSPATIPIPE